jgi:hypothetical protein
MFKIGVLGCGFECEEYIEEVLKPWFEAKQNNLAGCEFVFSFVHGQFKEYSVINGGEIKTQTPKWYYDHSSSIDYFSAPSPASEAEQRNNALMPLLREGCDLVWLLDLQDEIYTLKQIEDIVLYIKNERFTSWFNLCFKNYVFDKNTYIKEPFCPPRIFRVSTNGFKLKDFFWDNDVRYEGTVNTGYSFDSKTINYAALPSKMIPARIAHIKHLTWLSNEKSKKKCLYQQMHFGGKCSYKWDDQIGLTFNEAYYKENGLNLPILIKE